MTTSNPQVPKTSKNSASSQADLRIQRGVRFADSEWQLVKKAAVQHKTSASEFVRNASLRAVAAPARENFAALPPSVIEILKHTYRAAYILSTLKRDELVRDGRHDELNKLVNLARKAEAELLSSA